MTEAQGANLTSRENESRAADAMDIIKNCLENTRKKRIKELDAKLQKEQEKLQKDEETKLDISQSAENREIEKFRLEQQRKRTEYETATNPKRESLAEAVGHRAAVEEKLRELNEQLRQLNEHIAGIENELKQDETAYGRSIAESGSEEKIHISYQSERQSIQKSTSDAIDLCEKQKKADEKQITKEYTDKIAPSFQLLQSELSISHSTTELMVPEIQQFGNVFSPSSQVLLTADEVSTSTGSCSSPSVGNHSEISRMTPESSITTRSSSAESVTADLGNNSLQPSETVTQPSTHLSGETSEEVPRQDGPKLPFLDRLVAGRTKSEEEVRLANSSSVASSRNPSPSELTVPYRQIAPTACMLATPENGKVNEENSSLLNPTVTNSGMSPNDTVPNHNENLSPPSEEFLRQESSMLVDESQHHIYSLPQPQPQPQVELPIATSSPPKRKLHLLISSTGIYLEPKYLNGVPAGKIEETDPYFTSKSWKPFRELMKAIPRAPATSIMNEKHDETPAELKDLEKWLHELSFHPNQILAKEYLPPKGLVNRSFLTLLRKIFNQLQEAWNHGVIEMTPLNWMRQHLMHELMACEAKPRNGKLKIKSYLIKFEENNIYRQLCQRVKERKGVSGDEAPTSTHEQENISSAERQSCEVARESREVQYSEEDWSGSEQEDEFSDDDCLSDEYSPNKKSNTEKSPLKHIRKRKRNAGMMASKSAHQSPSSKRSRVDDCSDSEDAIYVVPSTPPRPVVPEEEDSLMVTLHYGNHNAIHE